MDGSLPELQELLSQVDLFVQDQEGRALGAAWEAGVHRTSPVRRETPL